jgi:aldehyde:ferredoxin oxidoreductase
VMECFEGGFLTGADTGGLEFRWGDADLLVRAVQLIARREGFGDIMAEGVARMSAKFGPQTEPFNLTVKGQELPMHDPRLKHALGLGYAVSPVGADHNNNVHDTDYTSEGEGLERVNAVLKTRIGPLSNTGIDEDKMQIFYHDVNWRHFEDCAVICQFYPYSYQHLAEAISGATGIDYSLQDVLEVGERAQTLSRLFNLREGLTAEDDRLPKRVRQAFETGPLAGIEIKTETLDWARRRFYELMLWDPESGVPSQESLSKLELDGLMTGIL